MKLHLTAAILALTLSSVAIVPTFAAAAATPAATTAMTAKPKAAATPDPKRYTTEALAAAACPTDTVVWANTKSKIFHLKGTSSYGKGKNGTYMCETDATAEKFKPTKKPEKVMAAAPMATTKSK
jgi:hypothetical protein